MAGERELNFGADATDAQYRIKDDTANGRFIVAEDLDGGTVLLEYDESANSGSGGWVFRGPVDLGSNDLSTTGEVSAASVSTEKTDLTNALDGFAGGQVIDSVEDTDPTTQFDGLISGYNSFDTIFWRLRDQGGTGRTDIRAQVDGTTSGYVQEDISAGTSSTGNSYWSIGQCGRNREAYIRIDISIISNVETAFQSRTITMEPNGGITTSLNYQGNVDAQGDIRLFTDGGDQTGAALLMKTVDI